jgi:hypothetical protein
MKARSSFYHASHTGEERSHNAMDQIQKSEYAAEAKPLADRNLATRERGKTGRKNAWAKSSPWCWRAWRRA